MAETAPATIIVTEQPTPAEREQVLGLLGRAAQSDGHQSVNEAGLLALRRAEPLDVSASPAARGTAESDPSSPAERKGDASPVHVLARSSTTSDVVGYAQAIWEVSGPVAALVVDPDHRRRGIGSALWRMLAAHTPQPLRVWASGDSPAARALAGGQGLRPVRTLLVLGRSLSGDLPPSEPPAGVAIRTFRPGRDEADWLTANARAFAGHPEQGSMTRSDLEQRMSEPWFDPAGFFLAVREDDEVVVGFHWTKRETGSSTGEVYVIGVDPTAGIRGLGTPLLGAGLHHLREIGATDVDLYVEADNDRALALYRRYGFGPVSSDVMYAATVGARG